jgi:hypothetical protein
MVTLLETFIVHYNSTYNGNLLDYFSQQTKKNWSGILEDTWVFNTVNKLAKHAKQVPIGLLTEKKSTNNTAC